MKSLRMDFHPSHKKRASRTQLTQYSVFNQRFRLSKKSPNGDLMIDDITYRLNVNFDIMSIQRISICTNIINNIVCITIMVPVGITLLQNVDYNPAAMITLFCLVLLQGIVLPSSSMAGAMLHGNSEWISPKNIYKYGCILELIVALAVAVVGVPLAPVIFSLFA